MMNRIVVLLTFVGVVAATIVGGLVHGHMSLRWGPRPDMQAAADLLQRIPTRCGNWHMESSQKMTEGTVKMLRCTGYISRRYVHQETGEAVSVNIVFGHPGPISEHTPEVCVASRDFAQMGSRQRVGIARDAAGGGEPIRDELWFVDFQKNDVSQRRVRTYWAWSTGTRWSAPDGAKTEYAGARHLYKIQLSTRACPGPGMDVPDAPADACGRFCKAFLPVAQRHLVAESTESLPATDTRN